MATNGLDNIGSHGEVSEYWTEKNVEEIGLS